jgi:hypothetical protein
VNTKAVSVFDDFFAARLFAAVISNLSIDGSSQANAAYHDHATRVGKGEAGGAITVVIV